MGLSDSTAADLSIVNREQHRPDLRQQFWVVNRRCFWCGKTEGTLNHVDIAWPTGESLNLKFIPVPQSIAGRTSPAISRFGLSRHARRHLIWVAIAAIADMVDIAETMWMTVDSRQVQFGVSRLEAALERGLESALGLGPLRSFAKEIGIVAEVLHRRAI
jgi:hypothetical protein